MTSAVLIIGKGECRADAMLEAKTEREAAKAFREIFRDSRPLLDMWLDCIEENAKRNIYSDISMCNGEPTGHYAWSVEKVDGGKFYVSCLFRNKAIGK